MIILRALLFPFSVLYDWATLFRNHLYDIGHKKSFRFETMVVGVGNLNVGGSGKTPMIEYLIRLLLPEYKLATLSRGYGRKTKGIRFACEEDSAATIGDEPFQFYRKFGHEVNVTVAEDRAFAIPNILQRHAGTELILMDDAFQHRAVDPQLSILLTDFNLPFFDDFTLPAGRLRERRSSAKRSDVIVVTKCPQGTPSSRLEAITRSIQSYAPEKPVFFAGLKYSDPISFGSEPKVSRDIVLVTGIADSRPLEDYARSRFNVLRHFLYGDHHGYSLTELLAINEFCDRVNKPVSILTTEKDMVKLIDLQFKKIIEPNPWFYLPVQVTFLKNGSDFDTLVLQSIEKVRQQV